MKISLFFSNHLLTQSIDFYINSVDENELRTKYFRIVKIISIQFPDYYFRDIIEVEKTELLDYKLVEALIYSFRYNI